MVKRIILLNAALLFLLSSCGGSGYTTDMDKALDIRAEQVQELEVMHEGALAIEKDYLSDRKDLLAVYQGRIDSLMSKVESKDEAALDALAELREIEATRRIENRLLRRRTEERDAALEYSLDDIRRIYGHSKASSEDKKAYEDFKKAMKIEGDKADQFREEYYKKLEKINNTYQ